MSLPSPASCAWTPTLHQRRKWWDGRDGVHIAIIQLYLRTGETLQSSLNAEILANLFGFLNTVKAPFIIGGDWQKSSQPWSFKASSRHTSRPLKARPLCRAVNWTTSSSPMRLELETLWDVPWRPHCALIIKYNCTHVAIPVQQIRSFPPIGRAFNPEHAWSDFPEKTGPFYILNYQITGLGTDLARWCTRSELYLTQQVQNPKTGRGSQVDLFTAPLSRAEQPSGKGWQCESTSCTTLHMMESMG